MALLQFSYKDENLEKLSVECFSMLEFPKEAIAAGMQRVSPDVIATFPSSFRFCCVYFVSLLQVILDSMAWSNVHGYVKHPQSRQRGL